MFYSWDKGRHHLELEIIPGKVAEFFYRDRETGTLWGEDYTIGDVLPSEGVDKLELFIIASGLIAPARLVRAKRCSKTSKKTLTIEMHP